MAAVVPATPARPVPGIWPQTPAPRPPLNPAPSFQSPNPQQHRPSLTTSSLTTAGTGTLTTARPSDPPTTAVETLRPVERAARTINEALQAESRFPELDSYLSQGFSSEYDIQTSATWAPFAKVGVHPIPDEIFEQYNNAQVSASMGLFAELKMAWVTIDNALYMWDYTMHDPELLGFEDQPHSIISVKLAKPKKQVFLPHISHVIVLATTSEVMLLGLGNDPAPGASSSSAASLSLFQTGMSVSVKGLDVSVIAASNSTGRIFFGGRTENEIYELTYQPEDRWFSSRCAKYCHTSDRMSRHLSYVFTAGGGQEFVEQIAVDESRNLLYTLSSASNIRVFHIKDDGTLPLLITKRANEIYAAIAHNITPSESLNPKVKIVSISAIPLEEATRYHLIATTATGYRIYLSATSTGYFPTSKSVTPSSMQAQHVRMPPLLLGDPAQSAGHELTTSSHAGPIKTLTTTRMAARYSPGYFFCFTAKDANSSDRLFISTPDAARLARPPESGQPSRNAESAMWVSLTNSRAEDIGLVTPYSAPTRTPLGYGNDLAVQFDQPVPEIAVLTNTGVHVIRRRRLVDVFAALLRQGGGTEGFQNEVNNMIRSYGRTELLATTLAVACGQGADPNEGARSMRVNDPEVLELARKVFIEYGGKPSINQNLITDKSTNLIDNVRPSPRHAAIAVYLSRLLRSTWKNVIAVKQSTPTGDQINPATALNKLRDVQEALFQLQKFFKTNKSFIKGLSGPDDLTGVTSKDDEIALKGEHRALNSLVKFVSDTIEGISFILVLFEEKVIEIEPLLPEASRSQFLQLTFEQLFTTKQGFDLAKELVKAIVNRNIAKGSNVETVAEALRRKCGSFCSADDVVIFKAQEKLKSAGEGGANYESSRNLLNDSLRYFEQVAHALPSDYLQAAVKQYTDLAFFAGAIQLVLKVAHEVDRANESLSWMADGRPEPDARKEKFEQRSRCYDLIHNVIIAVDKSAESGPSFVDGRPTLAATRRNEAYDVISRSTDEAFLTNLYDWYLSQGWYDRLLATDSSFIVTYLQRKSSDDINHADLLWKYYGQTNQFYDAAKIQLQLARSTFNLSLEKRIEYLSRARANASTYTQGGSRKTKQQLLQEISGFLDIAMIQDEILQRLKDDQRLGPDRRQDVLNMVDGPILDVTTLFNNYADNAGYYDLCLMIYQVADHRDPSQIRQTWQQLLQSVHDRTQRQGEIQPFEAVAEEVRGLGSKLRLSETTFPVSMLVQILERYSFEYQHGVAPSHWVADIFIDLEVPYERIFEALENMLFSGEAPFSGGNRKYLVSEVVYVAGKWYQDSERAGGAIFGGDAVARRVGEILEVIVQLGRQGGVDEESGRIARGLVGRIAEVLQ